MMSDSHPHQMRLRTTYPSGAEEWDCPTCGRRFIMQWSPRHKRIVLEAGDAHVAHAGGKGGLMMGTVQIQPSEQSLLPEDDLRLDLWQTWFNSDDAAQWWPEGF
ncbi:MAG: hypothetical protein HY870_04825 [Chloroflexi bacterium]|nr:hypothetical protein [Chloroflexota bacterium]